MYTESADTVQVAGLAKVKFLSNGTARTVEKTRESTEIEYH
jgi:hypothetical protein